MAVGVFIFYFLMIGIQCEIMLLAFNTRSLPWFAFTRSFNVTLAPLLYVREQEP